VQGLGMKQGIQGLGMKRGIQGLGMKRGIQGCRGWALDLCSRRRHVPHATLFRERPHCLACNSALHPLLFSPSTPQADILEHRQEQIKAEEIKLRSMQAQVRCRRPGLRHT